MDPHETLSTRLAACLSRPWPSAGRSLAAAGQPLVRAVLPDEFRSSATRRGVTATVVVEASEWIADNDWVRERYSRNPRFRGIRLNGRAVDETMRSSRFGRNLSELAERPGVYCKLSGFVEAAAKHQEPVPRDHSFSEREWSTLISVDTYT